MRELYSKKMQTFRYELEYYNLFYKRCVFIKHFVQVGTAIASSAAIGAWVAWTEKAFVWGLVIVVSQVINAVYDVLPIKNMTEKLSVLLAKLEPLYLEIEETWIDIDVQNYSDNKIKSLLYGYENRWVEICNNTIADEVFLLDKGIIKKSKSIVKTYMEVFKKGDSSNGQK